MTSFMTFHNFSSNLVTHVTAKLKCRHSTSLTTPWPTPQILDFTPKSHPSPRLIWVLTAHRAPRIPLIPASMSPPESIAVFQQHQT